MLIVQKYGGTSLSDAPRLYAAARRIVELSRQGAQIVAVVSARGDTTDKLIDQSRQIAPHGSAREMDMCLATGEQLCAALMAMAIGKLGGNAISLTGWQAGLHTDSVHGNARILSLGNDRIRQELACGNAVIVTGFQGVDKKGDITTLGRGGSDTTAVALAAFLQADMCQIFTDVDGVYDRDPRRFSNAVLLPYISYEKMLALIEDGAQVLHDRSVEIAQKHRIPIHVLSAFSDSPGTVVGPEMPPVRK